jgi:hypothetical protein
MKKLLVSVVGLAAFLTGCAHGGTPVPIGSQVRVSITPTSATVQTGTTLQFTATVTNTSNTAVTWQVNGTAGGNATLGTISASGLYTVPSAVPPSGSVTVAAVSQADSTASASATVTITAASNFSVSPSAATVLAGATQQFSVTVVGTTPVPAVSWQVNGIIGGDATVGTISTGGLYAAPANPPSGQKVTVAAVSQADASQTASAQVTVVPSLATLNGQYTFSFSGHNSQGFVAAAGSFQADGKGNVTNGIEDINSGAAVLSNVPVTGTYTVGQDGRGSLVLTGSSLATDRTQTFRLAVLSSAQARLVRFDTSVTASGNLDLQDPSAFAVSALNGKYVMNLDGVDSSNFPLSAIALVGLTGAGTVSATSNCCFMDENDNGGVFLNQPVTGSYGVASTNGRGTLTLSGPLGTFHFAFYVISAQKFRLVSVDVAPAWSGSANIQQASTFTNTSFKGNMVFIAGGNNSAGAVDDAGQFVSTGSGGITSGVGDENSNGTITEGYRFSGNYTISANGHGTLDLASTNFGTVNYSLYLVSTSEAVLLRADSGAVSSGSVNVQTLSQFGISNVIGPYVFTVGGVSLSSQGPLATSGGDPLDKMGQFTADGSGSAAGTEDINDGGSLNGNLALTATYSTALNGRGTLDITAGGSTRLLNSYLISPSQMFLIGIDADQVVAGRAGQQFP